MSDKYGWRSFWWLNVALYAAMLVFQLLLYPETHYDRRQLVDAGKTDDKLTPSEAPLTENEKQSVTPDKGIHGVTEYVDNVFRKGSPTKSQFTGFTRRASKKESWLSVWTPIMLFSFPIIEWTSFAFSWSASCFLMLNLTQSQVFAAPPYNMSALAVGLTNFAPLVGGTVGMFIAGPLSDWVSMRATRKNRGIREPEMRLPTLVPFVILAIIGALVTAYGYQNLWKMEVIVIVGYTLLGLQVRLVATKKTIDTDQQSSRLPQSQPL